MKNIFLIVNPKSGTKDYSHNLNIVINEFKKNKVEYTLSKTKYSGHAIDLVRSFDIVKYDSVCAIGGDGTLYEVLNGMLTRRDNIKIPIGLLPGGTGNSFLKTVGNLDLIDSVNNILRNIPRNVDVMEVNALGKKYYSLNLVGWGMATDISVFAEKLRFIGGQRYNIASIFEIIKNKKRIASLIVDGEERKDDFCFIISCNTKYIGKGMKIAPKALIDDGLLDLIIVKKTTRATLLSVFPKIFNGTHIDHDACEYVHCNSFSIIPEENGQLNIDGEIIGATPVDVNILKGGINLLV